MPNYRGKPGVDFSYEGSFKAVAAEDIDRGEIVWVTSRQGRRKVVSLASAATEAAGGYAKLYVAVGGAAAGNGLLVAPMGLVTDKNTDDTFNAIAALSGGSLGDRVYLSDTPGAIDLSNGTIARIIGTYVDDYSYEFSGGA